MFSYNLADYDFTLPESQVASFPLPEREKSRLLHIQRKDGRIRHFFFQDLGQLLNKGDLLVFNDTRVRKCRFYALSGKGREHEVILEGLPGRDGKVRALVSARKKLKKGDMLAMPGNVSLVYEGELDSGALFQAQGKVDERFFEKYGAMPIPPYLNRKAAALDDERYQTVFAAKSGAQAAPTASLHFSETLLTSLKNAGIAFAYITLYVGFGTFLPIRVRDIRRHVMHAEAFEISHENLAKILNHKKGKGRLVAVGTTSLRVLESVYHAGFSSSGISGAPISGEKEIYDPGDAAGGRAKQDSPGAVEKYFRGKVSWNNGLEILNGRTSIYIYPGYEFKMADCLITNFHTPQSSLLLLVSAFYSREGILHSYAEAIKSGYRFFSYGDAMFLE